MDKSVDKRSKKYASIIEAYKIVFNSPAGELVLMDLMQNHGILQNTFNGDIHKMLIREGERNAILRILSILKVDVKAIYERIDRATQDVE